MSQAVRGRPRPSRQRLAVYLDEPKRGLVSESPLEVVHQRPVDVAANVDALGDAGQRFAHRRVDEADALRVDAGGDAAFGDEDRNAAGALPRAADRTSQGLRVVLVAPLRGLVLFALLSRAV